MSRGKRGGSVRNTSKEQFFIQCLKLVDDSNHEKSLVSLKKMVDSKKEEHDHFKEKQKEFYTSSTSSRRTKSRGGRAKKKGMRKATPGSRKKTERWNPQVKVRPKERKKVQLISPPKIIDRKTKKR